ncbi:serine threonine [Cordyceps militaris]|uniref:non-specific serine/threonine protein kinase n=1 Tax=Cordyceps militaris TaxID=73501 RepID=A0A2H4SDD6_CORMI|nr:serine threonine [Cordyceps militaris]
MAKFGDGFDQSQRRKRYGDGCGGKGKRAAFGVGRRYLDTLVHDNHSLCVDNNEYPSNRDLPSCTAKGRRTGSRRLAAGRSRSVAVVSQAPPTTHSDTTPWGSIGGANRQLQYSGTEYLNKAVMGNRRRLGVQPTITSDKVAFASGRKQKRRRLVRKSDEMAQCGATPGGPDGTVQSGTLWSVVGGCCRCSRYRWSISVLEHNPSQNHQSVPPFPPSLPSQLFPTTSTSLSIISIHHHNHAFPEPPRFLIPTLPTHLAELSNNVPLSPRLRTFTTPGCFPPRLSPGHKINQNVDSSLSRDDYQSTMMEQPNNSAEPPLWPHERSSAGPLAQSASMPLRTASSTPVSSPSLFSPTPSRHILHTSSMSESNTPAPPPGGPFLHPLQTHKVRETHKALIDNDNVTGRKVINQYEVIEEIGRGMHGKVKLARNLETGENVAIKIIPRFSKKRRLGKVTAMSHEDKTKKEIAILKKIRHPNVVALLEIIDDPELKKIYMVLEHVELGEVVWRKKGLPHVCLYERRRAEREMRGEPPSQQEIQYDEMLERRQVIKELKRARMAQNYSGPANFWSVEHGAADESGSVAWSRISKDDLDIPSSHPSRSTSPNSFQHQSRRPSATSFSVAGPTELSEEVYWEDNLVTPGPPTADVDPVAAIDGLDEDGSRYRRRSPSMADSIISHMSSIDYNPHVHDPFADDYSYVPCFTFDQARSAFQDTVLGLEYLHYQGVVHRDIKPANLLWSKNHRIKISDFGVSYFGRPNRDGEPDDTVLESEAKDFDNDLELAKTVGTPAFFAPELCYTDLDKEQPKVSEQIDVWSLGVTLYCLIFARIPFLAEDEFQMFKKIATDDVYIPRRRLAPVHPSTSPAGTSLYKRQNSRPYRDDNDVVYEDVDNLLYDLLRQMLTKNPEKRIRVRDIKRHPWVVQGLANPRAWAEETDPARPLGGRKIQVDEKEVSAAVVPLTFLERARSAVKKAVGKVIHPLGERSDSKTRRRADSSAASSTGDNYYRSMPTTPHYSVDRRSVFMPDDYLAARHTPPSVDHSATPSVTIGAPQSDIGQGSRASLLTGSEMNRSGSGLSEAFAHDPSPPTGRTWHRATASQSKLGNHFLSLSPVLNEPMKIPPFTNEASASGADSRQKFSLFNSLDKRAAAQVSLSRPIVSGGSHHGAASILIKRPIEHDKHSISALTSPLSSSPVTFPSYRNAHPKSDPDFQSRREFGLIDQVDSTDDLASQADSTKAMASSPESSIAAHLDMAGRRVDGLSQALPIAKPRPMSLQQVGYTSRDKGSGQATVNSASTDSMEVITTPLTSPSETTSPMRTVPTSKGASEKILAFQSDPSLPALLSNASSVSADMEGELLGRPGVVHNQAPLPGDGELLSSESLGKINNSYAAEQSVFNNPPAMESGTLAMQFDQSTPQSPPMQPVTDDHYPTEYPDDEDGSDDGFWLMTKSKRKTLSPAPRRRPFEARRRDTNLSNVSVASDETAKRVVLHPDDLGI